MTTRHTNLWKDVRAVTQRERLAIGYHGVRDRWQEAPAEFTDDTLVICGHPVMERWEDEYMRTLARIATKPGATVLEVGFGLGISAAYVQKGLPGKHIVIEANADVFRRLEEFKNQARFPVEPLFGFWEERVREIPDLSIDGILFDTYPLAENEIHTNHFRFFAEAFRMLKPGGVLTYYSDEIHDFSPRHREGLNRAGFTAIDKEICAVEPPPACRYWKSPTIVAPIITK